MRGYTGRQSLEVLWKMLVRDVLASLAQHDPAGILDDAPGRAFDYDAVARRIVRRLLRDEVTSLNACAAVVDDEINRVLAAASAPEEVEAAAWSIWDRWQEILVYDRMFARLDEWKARESQ